ncbi:MAG: DNA repair protein RadA [Leptospirillia bacterium]
MASPRTRFVCQSCGGSSAKWSGRCPTCNEWHSMVEERATAELPRGAVAMAAGTAMPEPITRIAPMSESRIPTGIGELDRVLGTGAVPGAVTLIGGDPGIGKSTLMLQASYHMAKRAPVLYISGEEAPHQVRMRAERLGAGHDNLLILAETHLEDILTHIEKTAPGALVVDSIQTTYSSRLDSVPGSVGQIREVAARLITVAKSRGIPAFLVGHVTKEGAIAGPRVLEHMVDTVLYFEGERSHAYRVLRAVKNRFGTTNEIGVFEMRQEGLAEVKNPSAFFLAERPEDATGSVVVAAMNGTRPILVEVQALVTPAPYGSARRTAIGIDQSRLSLLLAVLEKRVGLSLASDDVFINVVGGIRLDDPAVDLGVLVAAASSHRDRAVDASTLLVGEVGLAGEVRAVQHLDTRLSEAAKLGFSRFIVPGRGRTLKQAGAVPVGSVTEAIEAALG